MLQKELTGERGVGLCEMSSGSPIPNMCLNVTDETRLPEMSSGNTGHMVL